MGVAMGRSFVTAVALAGAIGVGASLAPAAADWHLPPEGYRFDPAPGCDRPNRPGTEIYNSCGDQMQHFLRARTQAYGEKKQLLVIFGANWCPQCKSLKTALAAPDVLGRTFKGQPLGQRVHRIEIAISTLYQGRVAAVPSGEVVLRSILEKRPDVKQRAIPFLAVIDPVTGRSSVRNLDDLYSGQGWNLPALATVIADAEQESLGGPKATAEPGWFKRKWLRWFGP